MHVDEKDDETTRIDAIGGTRSVVLSPFDFVNLILIEFIQIYDVLAILSKLWAWPFAWIDASAIRSRSEFRCVGGGSSPAPAYLWKKRARPLAADVRLSLLRRRVDGNRSFRRVRVSPSARNRLLHSADRRSSLSRARETHPRLRRLDTLFTVRLRRRRFRLFHCTTESQDGRTSQWSSITSRAGLKIIGSILLYLWIVPLMIPTRVSKSSPSPEVVMTATFS